MHPRFEYSVNDTFRGRFALDAEQQNLLVEWLSVFRDFKSLEESSEFRDALGV